MNKEELLYNEIYERTKDFGRTQFVRELMRLQRENERLKEKVKQLETNRDEAIKLIKSKNNGVCIKNGIEKNAYTFLLDFDEAREFVWELEEILERGKEDV